ncbi:MAG: glutamate--tRNA ligase [Candidatus Altiarchaeota archaeon]
MAQTPEIKLPGDTSNVVMRFAPNPNGPPTIGHARGITVNDHLVRKYDGQFILRFDDTDPKLKKPLLEAYDWYVEDIRWLGAEPDRIIIASDRMPEYYKAAEELIRMGKAYACSCPKEDFKKLKDAGRECQCRPKSAEENLEAWKGMLKGDYDEGGIVLRIKTDLEGDDPAIRDWVAFRIVKERHPRVGDKYMVWPMLDFESAIEDRLQGVTHIIRGKDLIDSEKRQKFVYDYMNWKYPITLHWGRIRLEDFGKFSTSAISKSIAEGAYSGWDDVRLPTLRAFRRRGITAEAIIRTMLALGLSESDISLSMENVYAENRKILDPLAGRYFFVEDDGFTVSTEGTPGKTVRLPLNPNRKFDGTRDMALEVKDNRTVCCIPSQDAMSLKEGEVIKLIGQYDVTIMEVDIEGKLIRAEYTNSKGGKKLHWTFPPGQKAGGGSVRAEILMPDGTKKEGYAEHSCVHLNVGDIVQFERLGFCRLDSKEPALTFCFGHS